jgi:hypothetical protein
MVGLTEHEDRYLLAAENRRYRDALDVALRDLAEAQGAGFARAPEIIADINSALAAKPLRAPSPMWPKMAMWLSRMVGKR